MNDKPPHPHDSLDASLRQSLIDIGIPAGMHSVHALRRLLEQALLSPVDEAWPASEYARRLLHLHGSGLLFIPKGESANDARSRREA